MIAAINALSAQFKRDQEKLCEQVKSTMEYHSQALFKSMDVLSYLMRDLGVQLGAKDNSKVPRMNEHEPTQQNSTDELPVFAKHPRFNTVLI